MTRRRFFALTAGLFAVPALPEKKVEMALLLEYPTAGGEWLGAWMGSLDGVAYCYMTEGSSPSASNRLEIPVSWADRL